MKITNVTHLGDATIETRVKGGREWDRLEASRETLEYASGYLRLPITASNGENPKHLNCPKNLRGALIAILGGLLITFVCVMSAF